MKLEGHSEAEVRVSFGLHKYRILYRFCITLRLILEARGSKFWTYKALTANLESVLASQNEFNFRSREDKWASSDFW